ncbi:cytoskeleton protein RodZ [Vibrio lamellibrachiae]|uniref:cytoskeleton protein RodZ n=1 Tax=Vibrio lamellibrachiae TaxID=2910253 RepID=UPI003D0DFF42
MSTEQDIVIEAPQVAEKKKEAGTILKERRIELGLSQKQIADRLRLRLSLIEGIEDNNFESGQVATFIRGYLRSYAKAVNIDESIVLSALADCGDAQHQEQEMMSFSRKTKRERHDSRIMMLTWGILAIIIAISSIWWWQNQLQDTLIISSSDEIEAIQTESNQSTQIETLDPVVESELSSELPEPIYQQENLDETTPAESVGTQTVAPTASDASVEAIEVAKPAEKVEPVVIAEPVAKANEPAHSSATLRPLTMTFKADCWIQVKDASGKVLSTGIKKAGQNINLDAKSPLNIILGAPESVSMTFASEPVDLSGYTSGKVARFTLP